MDLKQRRDITGGPARWDVIILTGQERAVSFGTSDGTLNVKIFELGFERIDRGGGLFFKGSNVNEVGNSVKGYFGPRGRDGWVENSGLAYQLVRRTSTYEPDCDPGQTAMYVEAPEPFIMDTGCDSVERIAAFGRADFPDHHFSHDNGEDAFTVGHEIYRYTIEVALGRWQEHHAIPADDHVFVTQLRP